MTGRIKFYVGSLPDTAQLPCIFLSRSQWDDYGFLTSFNLFEVSVQGSKYQIGTVKIAQIGQKEGRTPLSSPFVTLEGTDFYSLGQSKSFYDRLNKLEIISKRNLLKALNDLSINSDLRERVKDESAFRNSLIRFLGPLAISNFSDFSSDSSALEIRFSSRLYPSTPPTKCAFSFDFEQKIPGTVNAVIGKNGVGKTRLLANFVANVLGLTEDKPTVVGGRESISKVIVVSYSVFDRFFLPDQIKIPGTKTRNEYFSEDLKYSYIGLRERVSNENSETFRIASSVAFSKRFTTAVKKITEQKKYSEWRTTINPILKEAGFNDEDSFLAPAFRTKFRALGAGHKATISMLTNLFAEIEQGSLVVIDEPENHLHPSLLSATLHVLRQILDKTQSVAVISTHSPIVIQEVPAKYVRVLRKFDGFARFDPLTKESFGTSVDSLTSEVFGLTSEMPSYATVLIDLAKRQISLETLEAELERRLSAEARSFYLSMLKI